MGDDINWGQGGASYSTILAALQNIVTAIAGQTQVIKANAIVYPITVGLGGTGVAVRGATFQSSPANQSTASATAVMAGLGGATITPKTSGVIVVSISGVTFNTVNGWNNQIQIRYGTGAAPTNGAAVTGTAAGALQTHASNVLNAQTGFCLHAVITGLTIGVTYWIDVSLASSFGGGTASVAGNSITAFELTV